MKKTVFVLAIICILITGCFKEEVKEEKQSTNKDNEQNNDKSFFDNLMEDTNKSVAEQNAHGYMKAIENYVTTGALTGKDVNSNMQGFDKTDIKIKGKKPTKVNINLKNGTVDNGTMTIGGYNIVIKDSDIIQITKVK